MVCLYCNSKTRVINSRLNKRANTVWRRRKCLQCAAVYSTHEEANYSESWLIRRPDNEIRPFVRDKLFLSVYASCQHRQTALADATALTATIIRALQGNKRPTGVYDVQILKQATLVALNRFDKAASTHYAAFHKS